MSKVVSIWQCRFAAECVADVTARTLTAEAPSYATIMELDRKVRDFPLPEGMDKRHKRKMDSTAAVGGELDSEDEMSNSFIRCVLDHIRETVLMYIHRSFFAQAIIENPVNPLKSPYAHSFLAAYRASSTILKSVKEQFTMWPSSCARFWTMWTFAFSAAVVFGTVVTRGPRSPLAAAAMTELEQACILFTKASVYSIRATKALPILTRLAEKARQALALAKDPSPLAQGGGLHWNINIKQEDTDEEDELSIFAGHTRFVSGKKTPAADSPPTSSQNTYPTPPPQQPHQPTARHGHYQSTPGLQPPASMVPNGWPQEYMSVSPMNEPSPPEVHYSYEPPVRTHRADTYETEPLDWEPEQPRITHVREQHQYRPPLPPAQMQPPRVVPSQYGMPYDPPHAPVRQPQQPQYQYSDADSYSHPSYQEPQQPYSHPLHQEPQQRYASHTPAPHPQHPQPHQYQQQQQRQQVYVSYPPQHLQDPAYKYPAHAPLPNAQLAELGLAARDSRLDERWSTFMQDSGMFDMQDYRGQ
ncbi:hypothetical protein H0H81_012334 [Sphagnurus paluster]|uniref:Uncharacterized protein n=1 Tax=Sphagnurus paluster TaxID=117069 RepID=A0A9P7FPW7_9AGAR|nr:hypothetical protein H0H81_012334 [Sphagnurus paluster]